MSKEIQDFEKEVNSIDDIKEWSKKMVKIKEIKDKIVNEIKKMNELLENLNGNEIKKPGIKDTSLKSKAFLPKKKKDLDNLLEEYENTKNLEEKVKLFNHIQYLIKECEGELFDKNNI